MRPVHRRWLEYAIIHCMNPIATDNYDFERLIADGYAYVEP